MRVEFLLIGLGQIGASFGLALDEHKDTIHRVGYDTDPVTARKAKKIGAVDKAVMWLQEAIGKADIILLALPADQVHDMMVTVLPGMQEGAVLIDTTPTKTKPTAWAQELLPDGCSYVGLTPAINPAYLHASEISIDAAHADLFHKGTMAIVTLPETDPKAVKLATDLIKLVDSTPLFTDMAEADGLMAFVHGLPQLLGAALLDSTMDLVGWPDAQRIAGRAYASATASFAKMGEPDAIVNMAMLSPEPTIRAIDAAIASLQTFREQITEENTEAMSEHFEELRRGHDKWLLDRQEANVDTTREPLPKRSLATEFFGNLFGLTRREKTEDK